METKGTQNEEKKRKQKQQAKGTMEKGRTKDGESKRRRSQTKKAKHTRKTNWHGPELETGTSTADPLLAKNIVKNVPHYLSRARDTTCCQVVGTASSPNFFRNLHLEMFAVSGNASVAALPLLGAFDVA